LREQHMKNFPGIDIPRAMAKLEPQRSRSTLEMCPV